MDVQSSEVVCVETLYILLSFAMNPKLHWKIRIIDLKHYIVFARNFPLAWVMKKKASPLCLTLLFLLCIWYMWLGTQKQSQLPSPCLGLHSDSCVRCSKGMNWIPINNFLLVRLIFHMARYLFSSQRSWLKVDVWPEARKKIRWPWNALQCQKTWK